MTTAEAIAILRTHNKWRRGIKPYDEVGVRPPYSPHDIGIAIDYAINYMTDR